MSGRACIVITGRVGEGQVLLWLPTAVEMGWYYIVQFKNMTLPQGVVHYYTLNTKIRLACEDTLSSDSTCFQ